MGITKNNDEDQSFVHVQAPKATVNEASCCVRQVFPKPLTAWVERRKRRQEPGR